MTAPFRRPAMLNQVDAEEIANPPGRSVETDEAYDLATELAETDAAAVTEVDRARLAQLLQSDGPDAVVAEILHTRDPQSQQEE